MKRLYWRPAGPSRRMLVVVVVLAMVSLVLVEQLPISFEKEGHAQKMDAAKRTEAAFELLKAERIRRKIPIDPQSDPARTGMIGPSATPVTTASGNLASKRTSVNPNFAAVIVEYLQRLELKAGDGVAVGYSGSFPAINVSVLCAIEAMDLRPHIIASATSSDFGASHPDFMWVDMEKLLFDKKLIRARSLSVSLGGIEDQGIGLNENSVKLVRRAITRSGVPELEGADFSASLEQRMRLYDEAASGQEVRAYINVGGGAVSVGRSRGKSFYKPGINRPGPEAPVDSIIGRFLDRGVPVVQLIKMTTIADQFGLPVDPHRPIEPGTGEIFRHDEPNRFLAGFAFVLLLVVLFLVGRRARARAHLKTLPEGVVVDEQSLEARRR